MGRSAKTFADLNRIITEFNSTYAGHLTPHGQALVNAGLFTEAQLRQLGAIIPTVPLVPENTPYPFHNLLTTDLRLDRPINLGRWHEGLRVSPFVDFINLFNHAPAGLYCGGGTSLAARFGSFNFDYAHASSSQQVSDVTAQRGRLNDVRKIQIGVRVDW